MNIKSLLLGSAAALAAVSGARAADAVVIAEPEPMEYVRVCDTYGVGFYYIPGTETCLKVSGYVRYDIGIGSRGFQDVWDKQDVYDAIVEGDEDVDTNDTYYKRARFALRVDARSETELGTLRAYAQINFDWDSNASGATIFGYGYNIGGYGWTGTDTGVSINHAYIELGGFRIGKTDSLFSTFTGYASGVSNDGLIGYGPFDTHQISYTWNGGNGFSAAIALEEGSGSTVESGINPYNVPPKIINIDAYTIDSYIPHVVAGVGYTAGWGGVSGVVGYDSVWDQVAIKGRVDVNAMDALSLFLMAAWDSTGDDDAPYNFYAPWGGDWAVWFGGAYKFNEKTAFNFEIGYDEAEDFSVAANVDYELVPNLHVIPEITYQDNFDTDPDDNWGGFLRVQANFGG